MEVNRFKEQLKVEREINENEGMTNNQIDEIDRVENENQIDEINEANEANEVKEINEVDENINYNSILEIKEIEKFEELRENEENEEIEELKRTEEVDRVENNIYDEKRRLYNNEIENDNNSKIKDMQIDDVEQAEKIIKEEVYEYLDEMVRSYWPKEKIDQMPQTHEEQLSMIADYIMMMAKQKVGEVHEYMPEDIEINENNISKEDHMKLTNQKEDLKKMGFKNYAMNLESQAMKYAVNNTRVNPNFDIDKAIERENEMNKKLENGEITPEQARNELAKPLEQEGEMPHRFWKRVVPPEEVYRSVNEMRTEKVQQEELKQEEPKQEEYEPEYKQQEELTDSQAFKQGLSIGAPSLVQQAELSKIIQQKAIERANQERENQAKTAQTEHESSR